MTVPRPVYATAPTASHFAPGELSILVFGPGRGEAMVVIHPDGHLGVVDGCREPARGAADGTGDPVREFIRVWHRAHPELNDRLRFVALTHPHDDHYAGLARLMEGYSGRIDHLWSPFPTGDQYVQCFRDYYRFERPNADEVPDEDLLAGLTRYYTAFEQCRTGDQAPKYTCMLGDRRLYERDMLGSALKIYSVAPDDDDLLYAHANLTQALQQATDEGVRKLQRVRHNPNLTSGALVIRWGSAQVLLGGDLLCAEGKFKGWGQAASFVEGPVQLVKAAHHGSAGARELEMLRRIQPTMVVLTPFQEAKNGQPPKPEDVRALLEVCPEVALSSPPHWWTENGTRPQPRQRPRTTPARRAARNPVLQVTPDPPPTADGVGVSLDAAGNVTRIVLTGRADLYEL